MSAAASDKFKKVAGNTGWQLDASGISDAVVDTFGLVSASGLPTGTGVKITIDRVDSSGNATPSKMERIDGVISGSNVISCARGVEGTAQAHAGGAVVEIMVSADLWNDVMDGILAEHGQDGKHGPSFHALTEKTTPIDADEVGLVDSAASYVLKRLTILGLKLAIFAGIKPAEGTMWNGKIEVTDAAGITLALKTIAGTDPSASDPVYITLGGAVRTITSALSVSKADGTNWCNAGSSELATKEIDYFAYLGYNATDGVVIGFSRIPYANSYDDFSTTTTNEKYCAISTITNAAATDYYTVIGRFAATLSAGAGYTWSVPTYTAKNLIQGPIYETRRLAYTPVWTSTGTAPAIGNGVLDGYYNLNGRNIHLLAHMLCGSTTTYGTGPYRWSAPFASTGGGDTIGAALIEDSGTMWVPSSVCKISNTLKIINGYAINGASVGEIGQTVPMTWAVNDDIWLTIEYIF